MALTYLYDSKNYDTTKLVPKPGRPYTAPTGLDGDSFSVTITTAALADVGSGAYLVPVPAGKLPLLYVFTCEDLDSGTALAANLSWRTVDKNGTITDTALFTGASAFQAAQSKVLNFVTDGTRLGRGADGMAHLVFVVTTPAQTPAQGVLSGMVIWHG